MISMGKDDVLHSKIKEKSFEEIEESKEQKLTRESPVGQKKLTDDPRLQRKIRRETSRENLKIEDEAILGFLASSRRRRGFIGRNACVKGSEKLLNQLENLVNSNNEKVPGRPKSNKDLDNEKIAFYVHPLLNKYLWEYSQKNGHHSKQDAVRMMIREALRANGYPV